MAILQDMTQQDMLAEIARLTAANEALRVSSQRKVGLKVSDKGAVSMYGLGRFPVTLYRGQWERLLDEAQHIRAFIEANAASLSVKA
jgi:hypothetical protein